MHSLTLLRNFVIVVSFGALSLGHKRPATMFLFVLLRGGFSIHYHSADEEGVLVLSGPLTARRQNNRRPVH